MTRVLNAILALALLAASAAAIACSRNGGADAEYHATVPGLTREATATPPPATVAPSPSPTATQPAPGECGALPSGVRAGVTVVRTLTVDGVERSYRLHIPAGVETAAGLPVVLNFHGLGSSAAEQEAYSGLIPLSDREKFILITPDGTGSPRGWAILALNNSPADDVAFVDLLLDTIEAELCPDLARVYSTGMSNGAFFSSLLGCIRSDRIAAIAPVAGVAWSDDLPCGRPMPIIAFHGFADGTVPFAGGEIFGVIPYAGAEKNVDGWARHNGCEPDSNWSKLTEHVYRVTYAGCEAPTELIAIDGGGHTWPGAIPVPRLGPTTDEISAAEMIWAFFADTSIP